LGFGLTIRWRPVQDARRRAIAETSAFLSWAMSTDQPLPRIPRRRADRGGFSAMMSRPHSGEILTYWWAQALDRIRDF